MYRTRWGRDSVAACHAERLPVTDWQHPDYAYRSGCPARTVAAPVRRPAGAPPRVAQALWNAAS